MTRFRFSLASLRPTTVRSKLAVLFALVIGVISALIVVFAPAEFQRQATKALADRAASIGAMAAFNVRSAVFFDDHEAVRSALLGALENDDLLYIAASDQSGRLLASQGSADIQLPRHPLADSEPGLSPDGMVYRVVSPITFNDREIGTVWTVMSLRELRSKVAWARRFVASMSALLFLVGTGAVILVSTLVTNPLRRMVSTVERITDGDLSRRTEVSSSDEVGQLATAFNVMVNRLQDAQRELEAANCGLEARVAKRTHELEGQILERKRAEEGLKESEEQFRFLSEATFEGVAITDRGKILVANQRLADMLGYELSEIVGASTTDFVALESRDLFLERVKAQDVGPYEHLACRKDGSHFPVEVRANSMSFKGLTVWATVIRDLSKRKQAAEEHQRLEEQFRQVQKMEAVGRLAAGVAHDFNNLLTVIRGHTSLLLLQLAKADPHRECIIDIHDAAQSAASLTQQLLAFSRKQVLKPVVVDLNDVLHGVSKMLGRLLGEDIELIIQPCPELGLVNADPGQIQQVVMNLAVNARDAMPDGGRMTVKTDNVSIVQGNGRIHPELIPGEYIVLTVSDAGIGMDKETQARVFEPFFTTKEQGKGTGLGLSTVYGIVKQSGGYIRLYSEPNHGTAFKIYLPRFVEAPATAPDDPPVKEEAGGTETILLVEDAEPVRNVARRMLESAGYTVLEAESGPEAMLLSKRFSGNIDLLLTDVVMPQMSGRDVAEQIEELRPDTTVLYMSGYTDDAIVHRGLLDPDVALLEKPFTVDVLLRRVREVLDPASERPAPRLTAREATSPTEPRSFPF